MRSAERRRVAARVAGAAGRPVALRAGRPRDPLVADSIKGATRELLAEAGYGGVTLEAVARRAGVGRPTLYRRWKSKPELVHDAVFGEAGEPRLPDTGSLESDLRACVCNLVAMNGRPEVAAAWHGLIDDVIRFPGLREAIRPRIYDPAVLGFRRVIARAVERGEATAGFDADVLMDIISGAVIFRLSVSGLDVAALEDQLVTLITTAMRSGHAGGGQRRPARSRPGSRVAKALPAGRRRRRPPR